MRAPDIGMSNQFHSFRLDTMNECLWSGGKRFPLTPKAFSVLVYLVERPGQLVTKNEIIEITHAHRHGWQA